LVKVTHQEWQSKIQEALTHFFSQSVPEQIATSLCVNDPSIDSYFPDSGTFIDFNASGYSPLMRDLAAALVNFWHLNYKDIDYIQLTNQEFEYHSKELIENYLLNYRRADPTFSLDYNLLRFFSALYFLKYSFYAFPDNKEKYYQKIQTLLLHVQDVPDWNTFFNDFPKHENFYSPSPQTLFERIQQTLSSSHGHPTLLQHANFWFNLDGKIKGFPCLSKRVGWQLLHLANCSQEFGFKHLNIAQLLMLYRILISYQATLNSPSPYFQTHTQHIKLYLIDLTVRGYKEDILQGISDLNDSQLDLFYQEIKLFEA
jgi:hypothetical protein